MKKLFKYLKECRLEMKKVAWPSKATVAVYTRIVLITSLIFAIILGLVDYALLKGISIIF